MLHFHSCLQGVRDSVCPLQDTSVSLTTSPSCSASSSHDSQINMVLSSFWWDRIILAVNSVNFLHSRCNDYAVIA
jgi:hypothetical protein